MLVAVLHNISDLSLGYAPKDLYTWGINDLANLSSWIAMGVKFTGNGWSSNTIAGIRDALNRANTALGSKIFTALGLHDSGGLTFSFGPLPTCQSYICTDQGANTIGGNFDDSYRNYGQNYAEGIIHELGHVVDWHARPQGSQFGWSITDPNWLSSSGWWRDAEHGLWRITYEGSLGAPTLNALNTPGEDFADTFTTYVYEKTGGDFSQFLHPKAISWVNRQNALQVALDQWP